MQELQPPITTKENQRAKAGIDVTYDFVTTLVRLDFKDFAFLPQDVVKFIMRYGKVYE